MDRAQECPRRLPRDRRAERPEYAILEFLKLIRRGPSSPGGPSKGGHDKAPNQPSLDVKRRMERAQVPQS